MATNFESDSLKSQEQLDPELEAIFNLPSPQKEAHFIDYVLSHKDISTSPVFGGQNFEFYEFDETKMRIQ